jgi:hypothetical protein
MTKTLGLPRIDCQMVAFECAPMMSVDGRTWSDVRLETASGRPADSYITVSWRVPRESTAVTHEVAPDPQLAAPE